MAVSVTCVEHGGQEVSIVYALFANLSVSVEGRCRAKEPVVMERMHDRNTFPRGRVERRRGDYRKGVVHMNDIWARLLDKGTQLTKARLVPDYLAEYDKWIMDVCIGCLIQKNLMSMGSK
jgi:hypothetical protein